MRLSASIAVSLGDFDLALDLDVPDDAVVAVVGPNGAGKTTLIRALAGLVPLDDGWVRVGERVLEDRATGVRVPPEDRNLGVVFQEHRLLPNLTALENVAFGLRARGVERRLARSSAATWLERVGVPEAAALRPSQLSGGQAQRVGLARALTVEPEVLLLDEPLAAVDASARTELRQVLRVELARYSGARIVVTHDPTEAAALADLVVVLERGRVTQRGPLLDVTARPRTPWIAQMVGLNLLEGVASGSAIELDAGGTIEAAEVSRGRVYVAIRPNAVTLHRAEPQGSARNVWAAVAADLHLLGDRARVKIEGPVPLVAEVTAASVSELHLADGGPIWASVKATDVTIYPG